MSFEEQASLALRTAGGRLTNQRRILIHLLNEAGTHLDAEGLYDLARQQDSSISLATVYRTLNILEQSGILQQRYLSQDHDRKYYEPIKMKSEYYFTCRRCHRIIPFEASLIEALKAQLEAEKDLDILNACICFNGLCSNCRQKGE